MANLSTADLHRLANSANPATGAAILANLHKQPEKPATVAEKPATRGMNGLETKFAAHLERRKLAGEIKWWGYECIKLRLADGAFYRPDFVTVDANDKTEIWETKGSFMREAARIRLKVSADRFPWPFYLVRLESGEWSINRV